MALLRNAHLTLPPVLQVSRRGYFVISGGAGANIFQLSPPAVALPLYTTK